MRIRRARALIYCRPHVNKLLPLLALYFAQGLPFGFQASALPLLLRERGVSLQAIGFASLLSAPWLAKALWAPFVDRFGSRRFGRRRSWIVPMQAALALSALAAAETRDLSSLALWIFVMNLCAATQDIAVDGWAVSTLSPEQLGPANALQVVGYKLGMLTGGGLLVWASALLGWTGVFRAIAALMVLVMLVALCVREEHDGAERAPLAGVSFAEIGARLGALLKDRASWAIVVVVTTYKTGEALADAMWKPMLLDRGFSSAQIGLWAGTFGMLCSLFGSAAAGVIARRLPLPLSLFAIACLRALGIAGEWWVSAVEVGSTAVIAVTCLEHLLGGAITTVMFALMMRHTDQQIGATHYTVLASLEVFGKLPASALSGVIAAELGYESLFALATVLSLAFALLARALARPLAAPATNAAARPAL